MSALRAIAWGMIELGNITPSQAAPFRRAVRAELRKHGMAMHAVGSPNYSVVRHKQKHVMTSLRRRRVCSGSFYECCREAARAIEQATPRVT